MDLARIAQKLTDEEIDLLAAKVKDKLKSKGQSGDETVTSDDGMSAEDSVTGEQSDSGEKSGLEDGGADEDGGMPEAPPEGMVILMDEGIKASLRVALEFDTREEFDEYKKTHELSPSTKVKIRNEGGGSEKKDAPGKNPGKGEKEEGEQKTGPQEEKQPEQKKQPEQNQKSEEPAPHEKSWPKSQSGDMARQVAIKDELIGQLGKDAKGWSAHKLHPNQMTPGVLVRFPDGTSKKYGELSGNEKARVDKALDGGLAAHKGMNDYQSTNLASLQTNIKNNLALYDKKDVVESKNEKQEPLTRENASEMASSVRDNARSVVHKYAQSMSGLSRPMLEAHVDRMAQAIADGATDGSLAGVKQSDLDELVRDDVKRLIHQEIETRRRSLGDHGIRHSTSNADSSMKMMDQLKAAGIPITGKDKLMALTVQANHDTGYTLGAPALDARAKGHQELSSNIASEEKEKYSKVFGSEGAEKIQELIKTHDKNIIDWDKDPVGSSVRMADISALFGKDKVQDLFIRSPRSMEVVCRMKLALDADPENTELHGALRKQLHGVVDEENFDSIDKDMLHRQVDEMTANKDSLAFTTKDVLARYSGRLDGFKFDKEKKVMDVNMSYSPEGQMVDQLFGSELAAKKFSSFADDLGVKVEDGKMPNRMTFGKEKPVVAVNIARFDEGMEKTATTDAMKSFATNTAREGFQEAKKALIAPPPPTKTTMNKARKKVKAQKGKFDDEEWDKVEKLFEQFADDPEKLAQALGRFPLLKSEKEYLLSKVPGGSAMVARVVRAFFVEDLTARVAGWFVATRGTQTKRKDKDLMSDTGGSSKRREREPDQKPPRDDVKKRFRTKDKPAETRDEDVDKDKDKVKE
jgi:hypothetical protein